MDNNQNGATRENTYRDDGRSDFDTMNFSFVDRYIKGIHFPVTKDDLISKANENNAPSEVMNILNRFDEKRAFKNASDIAKEVERVE